MVSAPLSLPQQTALPALQQDDEVKSMLDLVLRGQDRLNQLLQNEALLPTLIRKMLTLSVLGLLVHGLVVGATMQLIGVGSSKELSFLATGHAALWMPPVFVIAFLGALSICLPSFYFYTQLSGLDASFRLVTA